MARAKQAELEEEEPVDLDEEDGREIETQLTSEFIQMWPREIFDVKADKREGRKGRPPLLARVSATLQGHGVHILYRDEMPFYIGQAKVKTLFSRIRSHAITPQSRRYLFWNYFSAYVVKDIRHIDELEAILIAAMLSYCQTMQGPSSRRRRLINLSCP